MIIVLFWSKLNKMIYENVVIMGVCVVSRVKII